MNSVKTKTATVKEQTDSNRRSFLWKAGAAVSAGLAAAVAGVAKASNEEEALKKQLIKLKNENAIRELHRSYENLLDSGKYSEVTALFTDNAEVIFNGGVYKGKDTGISRLYREHFKTNMTGKKMAPAPGIAIEKEQFQEVIEVAEDGQSARARFPYSIQVGTLMECDSSLVQMARLHGEGIHKSWEGGVYDVEYIKDIKDGGWKINKLEHVVLAKV